MVKSAFVRFSFEGIDFDEVEMELETFASALSDMTTPLERSAREVMTPSIIENFMTGGRPETWAPLAIKTLLSYKSKKKGMKLTRVSHLKLTGELLTIVSSPNIWTIGGNEAQVLDSSLGPAAVYGGANNYGALAGHHAVIPPRPFMLIQAEDEDAIEQVFWDWISELLAEAGLA